MNVYEFLYEFDKLIETVDPKFKEEPVDTDTKLIMINIAQTRYLYNKYLNKPTFKENIESIQKNFGDLRNLIVSELITPDSITTGPLTGIGFRVGLTGISFLHYIRSDSYVTRTQPISVTGWTNNIVGDNYSDVGKITSNIYNKPILNEPIVYFEGSDVMLVIVDSYTTVDTNSDSISLTYLRSPKYMGLTASGNTTLTCELQNYNHEEMIRLAVDIYLKEYKYMLQTKQN